MKLLLDECAPKRLRKDFPGHEIRTLDEVGLKGLKNGELLRAAISQGFDALITVDQRMPFQQNLTRLNLAFVILVATPCRYEQLKDLAYDYNFSELGLNAKSAASYPCDLLGEIRLAPTGLCSMS